MNKYYLQIYQKGMVHNSTGTGRELYTRELITDSYLCSALLIYIFNVITRPIIFHKCVWMCITTVVSISNYTIFKSTLMSIHFKP